MPLKFGVIKQTVRPKASPEDVFDILLDQRKHSDFTGSRATTSRRIGVRFTAWDGYISGKNLKLLKGKKIVQEWKTSEWPEGYPTSRLEFNLAGREGLTELKMIHSRVPANQVEMYREGWQTSYWTPLKEYLAKHKASEKRIWSSRVIF